ncbi:MAG: M1 family metallopeptidase, partial [Frankiaceae bacterium]|nr:M1 family metallopeptidase [Frankiaceae bacterium]
DASILFRAAKDESRLTLDLGTALHVSSVTLDNLAVPTKHPGNKLVIETGDLAESSKHYLDVSYHGVPRAARAPTRRSDVPAAGFTTRRSDQVWALQEPYGAFTWYPVNDQPADKAYYDITFHTRKDWRGMTGGKLVSDKVVGEQRVTRFRQDAPAASYLVALGIGPYREHSDVGPHGLPITYWVRHSDRKFLPQLRRTPHMLRWLEKRLGPYPFASAGVIVEPMASAEETQTMVTMGTSVLRQPYGRQDLLHEFAHSWYGDTVTPQDWRDLWLNESFATYIQLRWEVAHYGGSMRHVRHFLARYDQRLRNEYGPPGDYHANDFAELNVYYCGARMLDRLHQKIGNRAMWRLLRRWPQRHHYATVTRAEWIRFVNHQTGHDYSHFIRHWLMAKRSPK